MRKITAVFVLAIMLLCPIRFAAAGTLLPDPEVQRHWARQQILTALEKGIMNGVGGGIFLPRQALTRAELAVTLQRMFDLDYGDIRFIKAPTIKDYYDDVQSGVWYSDAVMICAINEILPGDSREFHPRQPVTRLEVAQSVARCFAVKKIPVITIMMMPEYEDTRQLDNQEMSDVAFITNTGIMKGYNNHFRPYDPLSRAEAACVLLQTASVLEQYRTK